MKKITTPEVLSTLQGIINEGRDNPIEISGLNSPQYVLSKMDSKDLQKLDPVNMYRGISANSYDVQMSMLWTTLFWKISEQILLVGSYNTPFDKFYRDYSVGTDSEEIALRIKDGIDRLPLANSALFANYVTQRDSFYHRINQFKVFATTYDQYEIARIATSWDNITNQLNAELENLMKSVSVYVHDLSKNAFASTYLAGAMDSITLPTITDVTTAQQAAIAIHNAMDKMTLEANTDFIPFNRNSANATPIKDVPVSDLLLVTTADLMNNIEFLTTLNTYLEGTFANKRFALNYIKVNEFPTAASPDIAITPGYTPPATAGTLKAVLLEEAAIIFRKKEIGTFNFDNAATLKTSVFRHLDAMANVSDRRKCVAFVN